MKILKIEFQNINSLKGTHTIDFREAPFKGSSLFAITGPTGSGKSTILDVISLALFNQIPRIGKITRNEILSKGAILTRNQKEAFAKITYSCKSGIFESIWSISTNRNDNLRDYEMDLRDLTTDTLFDLKKSDVPAKNEELIGLNYNQFIKSVLLAQGEFAQFLKVKKDERGELLEKITGTWIYAEIGRKTFEKHKQVSQDIKIQQIAIASLEEKLLDPEIKIQLNDELNTWQKTLESQEKEVKLLERKIDVKNQITNLKNSVQKINAQKEQSEKAFADFQKEYGTTLSHHEKVYEQSEALTEWKNAQNELKILVEEKQNLLENQHKNSKDISKCLKDVSSFISSEVTDDDLSNKLDSFRDKVIAKREELTQKAETKKAITQTLTSETRELNLDINQDIDSLEAAFFNIEEGIDQEIKTLKKTHGLSEEISLDSEKKKIKLLQKNALDAKDLSQQLKRLQTDFASTEKDLDQFAPELKVLPSQIEHFKTKVQLHQTELEKLRQQEKYETRLASLEKSRADLVNGEPCPLCGALHHPFAEEIPEINRDLEELIEQTENKLNHTQSGLTKNQTRLSFINSQANNLNQKSEKLKAEVDLLHQKFKNEYAEKFKLSENWLDLISNLDIKLDALDSYEKALRKKTAITAATPLIKELQAIQNTGRQLKEEYLALYTGNNISSDCQNFQNKWTQYRQTQNNISNSIQSIDKKTLQKQHVFDELKGRLKVFIDKKDIGSIDEAVALLIPNSKYIALRADREKLISNITTHQTSLKTLNQQIRALQEKDTKETLETLEETLIKTKQHCKELNEQCEHNRRLLTNEKENQQELKNLKESITDKEMAIRRWRLLNELIGDSTGKKFNEFAQDLTLVQLIQLANKRLVDLSDRYRIDKPLDDEDDSLVAIDDHMGGQRRSVKTLSGGETFILSLSMALALSDLASRNVEINSLFIDEGFGTLDPETLDQTLDTLEKLQAESSKTIGVISHVDSLKERIATQIQLTRNGQGYSSLIIV